MHLREFLSSALPLLRELLAARAKLEGDRRGREGSANAQISQPNHKLTPIEIQNLVVAYQAGTDLSALSEQFALHRQTVRAHLKRQGIELRSDSPAMSEQQINYAVRLYDSGQPIAKVAQQLSKPESTVRRALHQRGVKMRPRYGG